jgi:phage gp46-like protein
VCLRGIYWADRFLGSNLRARKTLRRTAPSELEADARDALAPLLRSGDIRAPIGSPDLRVDVTVDRTIGRAWIYVAWSLPSGVEESTRYALRT